MLDVHTTRIRHRTFVPWLLGWSRWTIELEHVLSDETTLRDHMASGSWQWRPKHERHYHEFVYEITGVGEINCDDEWAADQLLAARR